MKRSLPFISVLLIPCICFLSCQEKAKYNWEWHVLSIECESMVEKCGNGPGLRFNSEKFGVWVDSTGGYEKIPFHYTICCENIPEFIDKMKQADSSRRAWIRDKTTRDANYTVEGKTEIRVFYSKAEEYSFMWFGHPTEAPVISIKLDEFEKLMKDIEERFRTCCLE